MKEITRIHLATVPFNIEIGARKALGTYLQSIEQSLGADPEAMREIEARIVELLTEHGVVGEKVLTSDNVTMIKEHLGEPAEFVDDEHIPKRVSTRRAVMRDPSRGMLGGVCAGLAALWGVDPVWVRLVAIVLVFITSGVMIPVYLAAWFVMPPARTAAERLLMRGEPVTPATIKTESDLSSNEQDTGSPKPLLTALRILAGIGLLALAAVTATALTIATFVSYHEVFAARSWEVIVSAFAIGASGVLFVTLCLVVAFALFRNTFTKKIGLVLITIAALGLICFIPGILGVRQYSDRLPAEYQRNQVEQSISIPDLNGIKNIVLDNKHPIYVHYTATPASAPKATLSYDKLAEADPKVTFEKQGDTLHITTNTGESACLFGKIIYCQNSVTVTLNGPVLDTVQVSGNNQMMYHTPGQAALMAQIRSTGTLVLTSTHSIDDLRVTLADEGSLDAFQANIKRAHVIVEDARTAADFAQLETLEATVPLSCAAPTNERGEIRARGALHTTVNGAPYNSTLPLPCTQITLGGNEEG